MILESLLWGAGRAGRRWDETEGRWNWGCHSEAVSQPDGSFVVGMTLSLVRGLGLYTLVLISPWIQAALGSRCDLERDTFLQLRQLPQRTDGQVGPGQEHCRVQGKTQLRKQAVTLFEQPLAQACS